MSNNDQQRTTKACTQCNKQFPKEKFGTKQWKKPNRACRLCAEYKKISQDLSRTCFECQLDLPRIQYDIYQWSRGNQALCLSCRGKVEQKILTHTNTHKELADGTCVCTKHSLEECDICMLSFSLQNQFMRRKREVGRELTKEEESEVIQEEFKDVRISRKICIMDGHVVCPRLGNKFRCPCDEVTYCSEVCQKYHWGIHKMTCKHHAKKKEEKAAKKKLNEAKKQAKAKLVANNLTEEQKNYARMEAFFAENRGRKGAIEECAWQLGEHPLVIGGGRVQIGPNGEEFIKGDVAKLYREGKGVEWDGSPRFGLKPYVQRTPPEDWIAKARLSKSQRLKDLEAELRASMKM